MNNTCQPFFKQCLTIVPSVQIVIYGPTGNILPETNIAPVNGWLEVEFLLGKAYVQWLLLLVSGSVRFQEEMLRTKMSENSEIAQLKAMSPDQEGPKASQVLAGTAGDFWPLQKGILEEPPKAPAILALGLCLVLGRVPTLKSPDFWS